MIKVDIISGFLGAGKTTLIKKLIAEVFAGQQIVLIENEFGEIGIDGGFLKDAGINISEMNSGCICCSLVGDFSKALKEVAETYHPDRIIIEPSGVGKLSDVRVAVEGAAEEAGLVVNNLITIADCKKIKMYRKNFGEFYDNQIENAGTVILSRTQMVKEEKQLEAAELIRELNPNVVIITTPWDELTGQQIMDAVEGTNSLAKELLEEEKYHHHHHHYDENGVCSCGHHHEEGHDHEHHHHDHEECCEHDHGHHHDHDHEERGCGHDHEHHHHDHDHEECCGHDHEHHHHDHDHEECCGHDHEHHHHDHDHEECCGHDHEHHHHHYDEDGVCSCGHHHDEDEHHHHHDQEGCGCGHDHGHHHHADDVFTSWGKETPKKFDKEELEKILATLSESEEYGMILRAKGMVSTPEGTWLHFDFVPGEYEVREGAADYTGRLCVIGSELKEDKLAELFHI